MIRRPLPEYPRRIILIKSHSAGIGDILRSSAAWAVLKRRWPEAELHLVFLTRWPGYPSESLISSHQLLDSTHFLPMPDVLRRASPAVLYAVNPIGLLQSA